MGRRVLPLMKAPGIQQKVLPELERALHRWRQAGGSWRQATPPYTLEEQRQKESAYDRAFAEVDQHARRARRVARSETESRLIASFARFAVSALDLPEAAVESITRDFLPIGRELARWARRFDPSLGTPDIVQACRNAWTACGMQPLMGTRMELTVPILAYSLLYPYSDNYLDDKGINREDKLLFSRRFRQRLRGEPLTPRGSHEISIWTLVGLIESHFPRPRYPGVHAALLDIHDAQEESLAQLHADRHCSEHDLLRISCFKGGTSVLADAWLVNGVLTGQQIRFAFDWGVLLQLGDDLQDVHEDLQRGSTTLFTRAIHRGLPLDALALQLLNFGDTVAAEMDALPHGTRMHKDLLRMSWRSLVLMAVGQAQEYCTPTLLAKLEPCSPFRFGFLRARRKKLEGKSGLFQKLFQLLLASDDATPELLPSPVARAAFPPRHGPAYRGDLPA
ncbi:hypothetical protein DYQ86_08190 [Acidobacteria bacterium AB60]|nr:hypothetical protein DYQ86_08190 [Acidobacteria bacterium AB60]